MGEELGRIFIDLPGLILASKLCVIILRKRLPASMPEVGLATLSAGISAKRS